MYLVYQVSAVKARRKIELSNLPMPYTGTIGEYPSYAQPMSREQRYPILTPIPCYMQDKSLFLTQIYYLKFSRGSQKYPHNPQCNNKPCIQQLCVQPQSGHSPPGAALQSSHQSGGVCLYPGIFSIDQLQPNMPDIQI